MRGFTIALAASALLAQEASLRLREPAPAEEKVPAAGKFSMTVLEKHRLLRDEETGHIYLCDRHDLVKPALQLLSVARRDGKYVYTYRVRNAADAVDAVSHIIFRTEVNPELESVGSEVWFDRVGVAPGREATITVDSIYPPHRTTAYVRGISVEKELERIETRPVPQGVRPEFFEYMEQAANWMLDSVHLQVVGPLPDSKAKH